MNNSAHKKRVSTEAIGFQKDKAVFNMLSTTFDQIKSGIMDIPTAMINLQSIIEPTGLNVDVRLLSDNVSPIAMIKMADINAGHAVYNDLRKFLTSMGKNDVSDSLWEGTKKAIGMIDRKGAKVSGFYSKIPFTLTLSTGLINFLSAREVAATVLHEIGHAFTYCELLTLNLYTNQALKTAKDAWRSQDDVQKTTLLRTSGIDIASIDNITDISEENYLEMISLRSVKRIDDFRVETERSWYDRSSAEFLADQFAVRMGAGKELVTGLDKIQKSIGNDAYYKSKITSTAISAMKITATAVGMVIPYSYILAAVVIMVTDDPRKSNSGEYDEPRDRYLRIRQDLISALSNRSINDDIRKETLESIKAIDKILKTYNESWSFNKSIVWLVSPTYRRSVEFKKTQQRIEKLAVNDLYVQAASLRS